MEKEVSKAQFLRRKSIGKQMLLDFKQKIGHLTGLSDQEYKFLPLEESEPRRQECLAEFNAVGGRFSLEATSLNEPSLNEVLKKLSKLIDCEMFLFFQESEYIGGMKLQSAIFFREATNLLAVDGDTVYGYFEDPRNGLLLDLDVSAERRYEIVAWGEWSVAERGRE